MGKIHTREKRKRGLSTHRSYKKTQSIVKRKTGEKTFSTETSAKKWAEKEGLKQDSFKLVKVKKGKRFAVRKK